MAKQKTNFWKKILIFLAVLGPGIITGSVDNDAGGITTYSLAGAMYGYKLIWTLIPAFIALVVIQEMNARMGIVTGKGLADLIRENAGVKTTFLIFIGVLVANIGNTATEFAGIAGSLEVFGISKYISVPLSAIVVWFIVVRGTYKSVEKIFLIFSLFLFVYVISALLGKPQWEEIGQSIVKPHVEFEFSYVTMVIGLIGTTICPWMMFYLQSSVIEKGLKPDNYKYSLWDVVIGSIITVMIAFFIIVACAATLHINGIEINEAKDAALALEPLAGSFAAMLFAFGLFIASIFSACILPIATAFSVCEAFGFEAGVDKSLKDAPEYYTIFTLILLVGMAIILFPNAPLIQITLWAQVANGILLPIILFYIMRMINNKEIMGDYTNKAFHNLVGWSTALVLIILSVVLVLLPIIE
jgi:NRAMP (natural resistance-associated macrophage protein)-like metal ion transporter